MKMAWASMKVPLEKIINNCIASSISYTSVLYTSWLLRDMERIALAVDPNQLIVYLT